MTAMVTVEEEEEEEEAVEDDKQKETGEEETEEERGDRRTRRHGASRQSSSRHVTASNLPPSRGGCCCATGRVVKFVIRICVGGARAAGGRPARGCGPETRGSAISAVEFRERCPSCLVNVAIGKDAARYTLLSVCKNIDDCVLNDAT